MNGNKLEVSFHGKVVGTLSETVDHRVAFAYTQKWLGSGFPISPFSLPLKPEVFLPSSPHFGGLFGVFADSLPDAWGQLLMNRMLKGRGINTDEVGPLARLAIIGGSGMGALCYQPAWDAWQPQELHDLDALAQECQRVLNREETRDADRMFALAGSSGGARPKVMTEEWIIKFPASTENPNAGVMEKAYMDCAKRCGISVPETRLLPSKRCGGYFSVRRFDRTLGSDGILQRHHMLTAAAILELDWRSPSMDYHTLMKLTKILCRDRRGEIEQMYRRMCFNVFAHNRDDHSKNFSFLYNEKKDQWSLSPAYDLTWSSTYYGEHTTTVDGNGRDPGMKELLAVGKAAGLPTKRCRDIAEEIHAETCPLEAKYRYYE
ncbi:MAG: type II toxin-antitoxin system HipA family toxin [Anaerolineaceae bacterium]|nr:type II toxin-antitoxin system HipA family toxin [Anaerolineaceae bacterium]